MILKHKIEFVEGDIDTETQKLSCGANRKYGQVSLCFDCGMSIGFASIKLHSSDTAKDVDAVFDDAHKLGDEIARRWNREKMLTKTEAIEILNEMREEDATSEMIADALGFTDDCNCESCQECRAKGF